VSGGECYVFEFSTGKKIHTPTQVIGIDPQLRVHFGDIQPYLTVVEKAELLVYVSDLWQRWRAQSATDDADRSAL
jgi:hypothetical protein